MTGICIASFSEVNQIKGAFTKNQKAVYTKSTVKNINIFSVIFLFSHSISLNKIEKLLTLTLETETETKKDNRKHEQENKQGSIDKEHKRSSK